MLSPKKLIQNLIIVLIDKMTILDSKSKLNTPLLDPFSADTHTNFLTYLKMNAR